MSNIHDDDIERGPSSAEQAIENKTPPIVPAIIIAGDSTDDIGRKRRELEELEERLKIRVGQIERAENRLLQLQEQLLGLPSLDERLQPAYSSASPTTEVFRVDISSEEPMRIAPTTGSPLKQSFLTQSTSSIAPTPQKPVFSTDTTLSHGTIAALSTSTPKNEPYFGSPSIASSLSPMNASRTKNAGFSIRSSGSVYANDADKHDRLHGSSSSTSSTLSFTLLKSLFGASEEKPIVTIKIDASQIRICERVPQMCSSDFDIYRANIGGWGCNVKMINLGRTESNDARFFKRVKLLEAMPTHPNIARYYFHDIAGDGSCCRIYTEWFQTNLAEVIEKRAARGRAGSDSGSDSPKREFVFSAEEIEFVLMEVVKGIEFLHSYSILHRTISPSNILILLDDEGNITRVAIANLDVAKVITDRVNARGSTMLDPRYCAPEVITAKKTGAYSFPSDIWSLGLIAYELLTLHRPWSDESDSAKLAELVTRGDRPVLDVPDFIAKNGSDFAPFVEIFNECTRVRPDDRPTVSIIKQALITKASIAEHRRASQLNIGFTYQPRREASAFFERFIVAGIPIGFRKPESAQPVVLYQYPTKTPMPTAYADVLLTFCMAQTRPSVRIKRTHSMSNVNQKLFASRDMTEHSSSASIFTMMDGEELRYGICVYFEEPVDIVPSFMSTQRVLEEAKKDPASVDWKRISKSTANLASVPTKRSTRISPLPTSVETTLSSTSAGDGTARSALAENPKRRRHQRTASDGSAFRLTKELAKESESSSTTDGPSALAAAAPATPVSLGHVKFTHRCYVLFSKWPFFKLHFEVLWALLAQERLARISAPETKISTKTTSATHAAAKQAKAESSQDSQPAPPLGVTSNSIGSLTTKSKARSVSLAPPLGASPPSTSPLGSLSNAMGGSPPTSSPASAAAKLHLSLESTMSPASASTASAPNPTSAGVSTATGGDQTSQSLATIEEGATEPPSPTAPGSTTPPTTPRRSKAGNPKRMTVTSSTDAKVLNATKNAEKASGEAKSPASSSNSTTSSTTVVVAEPEPSEENCMVLKMLGSYYRTPVPVEKHQTTLTLANHSPFLYTPGDVTEAVAEWCFPGMFRTLSVKTLVKLFTAVLLEEKIVMICGDTGVLTSCVTGLTAMLRPYAWQGTFLPILPPSMMDVLDSPVPFVAGVPSATAPRHLLDGFDGIVVDLHNDTITGRSSFPRLPSSDRISDAFTAYATSLVATGISSNPCKTCPSDGDALSKLLAAFALWHSNLLEHLAAVPIVGLDFKWGNLKDVDAVIRSLASSERDFYREFVETQHFSIISERLNTIICQIRARKDHQKDVQKLENIFTSN